MTAPVDQPSTARPRCPINGLVLVIPAGSNRREMARRSQCVNNLKEIGLATHNFASERGTLPPVAITAMRVIAPRFG